MNRLYQETSIHCFTCTNGPTLLWIKFALTKFTLTV